MWHKLLIIHLLCVLALLPAAQAISLTATPTETGQTSHAGMIMDCDQTNSDHCIEIETCVFSSYASCEGKSNSAPDLTTSTDQSVDRIVQLHYKSLYRSHHADLILRPPRNA